MMKLVTAMLIAAGAVAHAQLPIPAVYDEWRRVTLDGVVTRVEWVNPRAYVFVDVLDDYPPLGWYQIVQRERNRFLLRAVPAPRRHLNRDELRRVLDQGLRRFGLAGLVEFDIEITNRLAPDPKSGKLKRITSRLGPPDGIKDGRMASAVA